ncbi:tripartite tricarboxylate transporter substrate binding protein [Pigmentiphaga soli]|uniref:Tripartite tricarboxylate transporter substrate binding protein n=1 Tax=Pigmentiphaga soli TaxID=1007095 RepID=A0ABP8HCP6_9BURK
MLKALLTMPLVALALQPGAAAAADAYPQKPVRLLVGFSPGGNIDESARLLATAMSRDLGQQVVVDNRPGASTLIAADAVANAPPDGHTLMLATTSTLLAILVQKKTSGKPGTLDPLKSFAMVASVGRGPFVIAAHPSFPANDVDGFIAEVRAHPGKYFYATSGVGSQHHLGMELLMRNLGLRMTHVPYKGAGQILPDLMSGQQIKLAIMSSVAARNVAEKEGGRIKVIGIMSGPRIPAAPQLGSFSERIPDFEDAVSHSFVVAPPATPEPVVRRIAESVRAALKDPELVKAFASSDTMPYYLGPAELTSRMGRFVRQWGQIVDTVNLQE